MNRRTSHAILPIGLVNCITGKNAFFGEVWLGWPENASRFNALVWDDEKDTFMIVHGGGSEPVDSMHEFHHDQSGRLIGGAWQVLAVEPHTKAGLKNLAALTNKKCVKMATYK